MKKFLALLISLALIFSFTACVTIKESEEDRDDEKEETSEIGSSDSTDDIIDETTPPTDEIITELTEENIIGVWAYEIDYDEFHRNLMDMSYEEYIETALGVSLADLGISLDDWDLLLTYRMEFFEDSTVIASQDCGDLIEFNDKFYEAYADHIRENPEVIAELAGLTYEDLEEEAASYGYTVDEYVETVIDVMLESTSSVSSLLTVESEGEYELTDNGVDIDFVTVFEDYYDEPIESSESYELVDGALFGLRNETMEMTFVKEA